MVALARRKSPFQVQVDRPPLPLHGRKPLRNAVLAFALMAQILFLPQTAPFGILALCGTLALVVALTPGAALRRFLLHPLPHVFWVLALASLLWSVEPANTMRYGIQLVITTLLGMLLLGLDEGEGAIPGIATAFTLFLAVSLAFGQSVGMGGEGQTAFAGLTGSKNFLGGAAALAVLAQMAACVELSARGNRLAALLFACLIPLSLFVMILARSSGAVILLTASGTAFVSMLMLSRLPTQVRSALLLLILAAILCVALFWSQLTELVTSVVLPTFGKDPTLTGRVYLWQRADELIAQRPALGLGYAAFWVHGNLDAEGLWRWAGITGRMGFNFHNTPREILVHFGWTGIVIVALTVLAAVASYCWSLVLRPNIRTIYWFSVLIYTLGSVAWESTYPMPFNFGSMLILAAFTGATATRRSATPTY